MSDEALLLVQLIPLTGSGQTGRTVQGWGAYLTGPETSQRLQHGRPREGFAHHGEAWTAPVWHSEADILEDLQDAGWTLTERRPHSESVTLVLSRPPLG